MKVTKLEMIIERDVQPGKKGPNLPELAGKSDAELKNKRKEEKRREEKRREEKRREEKRKL